MPHVDPIDLASFDGVRDPIQGVADDPLARLYPGCLQLFDQHISHSFAHSGTSRVAWPCPSTDGQLTLKCPLHAPLDISPRWGNNAASAPSRGIEISRDRQQNPVRSSYDRARPAIQNSIMTILARLSAGRILLHLLAMLGDRCVRFHLEGIVRELPSIASALAMLTRMRGRLLAAVTLYLAHPIKHSTANGESDPQSLAAVLRRGDVLLTQGNSRFAALIKCLTRSPWSHVSMYVGPLDNGPDPLC